MSELKTKLMVEHIISDRALFAKCYRILKAEYFEPPMDRVIAFALDYFTNYKEPPCIDTIEAETGMELIQRVVSKGKFDYTLNEVELFCQTAAATAAVLAASDLVAEGKNSEIIGLFREAMRVRLDNSVGTVLFDNAEQRILENAESTVTYGCGIIAIDQIIGRIRCPDFGMVYAVSSGGKSLMLGNMGIALAGQQRNVHIITLELKEDLYAKRMDSMINEFDISHHELYAAEIASAYDRKRSQYGRITLKKMIAGTNVHEIEAHLMDYSLEYGAYPDVLIVDYLGLMGVPNMKSNNKFDIDHEKSIGLIRLGETYNMSVISAGQINREGYDVMKISPQHCAGGISVINNSDWSIALAANEDDMNNNQLQVNGLKVRHTARLTGSKTIYRNPKTLKISDEPTSDIKISAPKIAKLEMQMKTNQEDDQIKPKKSETANSDKIRKALQFNSKR